MFWVLVAVLIIAVLVVIGMNFLSQLGSWRVEDRTLFLVPQPGGAE